MVGGILLLSFLPEADKTVLHTRGRFHSVGHLVLFAAVGYVVTRSSRSLRTRVLLAAGALLFGFGIEFVECLDYHNPLEWMDVMIDGAGVIAGTLATFASAPAER